MGRRPVVTQLVTHRSLEDAVTAGWGRRSGSAPVAEPRTTGGVPHPCEDRLLIRLCWGIHVQIRQTLTVGVVYTYLEDIERHRDRLINRDVTILLERIDIDLNLRPEPTYILQNGQGVDESLGAGLELDIDDALHQLMSQFVTMTLDFLKAVCLSERDCVMTNKP